MHPRNQARLERHAEWFVGEERALQENVMKYATYLFSVQHPKGKLFNLTNDEVKEKLAEGWYENPSHVPVDGKPAKPRTCPTCGQQIGGPTQGSTEDTPKPPQKSKLLADFEAGKKQTKQQLAALGAELGVELVADDMTAKQMAEEIQAFLDTPALG